MDIGEARLEAQDLNAQGEMLLVAGRIREAGQKFDQAMDICPELPDSYRNYGDLYMSLQEYEKAKNAYRKALCIEKSGRLYFLYGSACFMNDELAEGLENYNRAIHEGYDSDEMMFFMGMAYEHMDDDDMALRYYQKACIKNPMRPDYMIKKISAWIRLGKFDRAQEAVEELLLKSPETFEGYHIKTQLLLIREKHEEAVTFAKAALERFPEDVELLCDYAKALALAKRDEEALRLINSAEKMKYFDQARYPLALLEGKIWAQSGQSDRAIQTFKRCLEMEAEIKSDGEVDFLLMNLYLADENYEEARQQAERIIGGNRDGPYYYAALYCRPFCLRCLGRTEEAKTLYREANRIYRLASLENRPENRPAVDLYLYRAMCLKDLGDYEKALEILEFLESLKTSDAELHLVRADIYQIQGKKDLAEKEWEKAGGKHGTGL